MTNVRSAAFALLLLLSLGVKFVVRGHLKPTDDATLVATLDARARAAGFTTTIERRPIGAVVTATKGDCVMQLRDGDGGAGFDRVFAEVARDFGRPLYLYHGTLSPTPPGWRKTLEGFVQHQLAAIGIATARPAVIMVARRPACGTALPRLADLRVTMTTAR
ncbi:hypothetical protein QH494_09405 [Sphingomonas sp. AR_OL41]|uniref:hypothetical protein n=1 Tax=Sphingomonas sp. AR_OL41 TaxID=3042729 RepID=UPI002480F81E|nr:hypothetical protein [Sphingomonas sp. AR_OL41]MDH7972397.1 hypothetical protein [Sphingomonas sp. AR_OL41]